MVSLGGIVRCTEKLVHREGYKQRCNNLSIDFNTCIC